MNILGISAGFSHDPAACIMVDGEIIYAIEEERIIRKKYADHERPIWAIKNCLEYAKLSLDDIDILAISWNPYLFPPDSLRPDDQRFFNALFPKSLYGDYKKPQIKVINHHVAHAAHVFWNSPFKKSCVLVMDGTGENQSGSVFVASKQNGIEEKYTFNIGESLGYFYQAASSFCGLGFMGSGKLMGLAAYGVKDDFVFDNITLDNSKGYHINNNLSIFDENMRYWYNIFAQNGFRPNLFSKRPVFTPEYIAFASNVQNTLNNVMVSVVNAAITNTGIDELCISGGVSMNSATNLCISEQSKAERVFTFAGGGDSGSCIGAAMQAYFEETLTACKPLDNAYLGNRLTLDEIRDKLTGYNLTAKYIESDILYDEMSNLLVQGKSVGVVTGREEFGARALGNRSILYNPTEPNGRTILNQVKKREYWRPFAPVILEKCFPDYLLNAYVSKYMTCNFHVSEIGQKQMAEAIHIDNTCRPQMADGNSFISKLLDRYYCATGSGALLNTSFNTKGNPIVHNVEDALREFYTSGLDCLLLENYLLTKKTKEHSKLV